MTTFKFDAEIGRVLNLVIGSIYTNKEIFLRELISNASDAMNKRKFLALSGTVEDTTSPSILVKIQKEQNALIIRDSGIGMNKEDLIKNIGTIASSGTLKFMEDMAKSGEKQDMIGQFGVGFYSAFMVANYVTVKTKKAGEKSILLWKSEGKDDFTIEEVEDEGFETGSEITLFIKEEEREEFLDKFHLEHIIKTYSNHISFPISLEHEEGMIEKMKRGTAFVVRAASSITKEEYVKFYNSISWMGDDPFITMHNKVEGTYEYTNLLFIPSKRPYDLYNPERKTSIKLFVKKVFITEDGVRILPEYLRFVRGVIDSADLPLNISRETLQNSSVLAKIGTSITKKIFSEFRKKLNENREEYKKFWKEFGNVIKEGLCRPEEMKDAIMEACIFYSSKKQDYVTMEEYISGMASGQESIYYLTADSIEDGIANPAIEVFKKKDIEVLILTDTVDDFWVTVATEFKGKAIQNISSSDEKTDELLSNASKQDVNEDEAKKAIEIFKNALSGLVADVKISHKLEESPVMLANTSGGMSIRMERYLMEQKQLHSTSKKTLELNLNHQIVKNILAEGENENTKMLILNLFDVACIAGGEALRSGSDFAKRMFTNLGK